MNKFIKWVRATYNIDQCRDILEHGADCGLPEASYFCQIYPLYDKYSSDLWDILQKQAENMGDNNALSTLPEHYTQNIIDEQTFKNYMVWFCIELIAFDIVKGVKQ